MELAQFFKSIIDTDRCAVVICDLEHKIIYMNPSAKERYAKRGGKALLGQNLLDCHGEKSREMIIKTVEWFNKSPENNLVYTSHNENENKDVYMTALRNDSGELIGYYEKHEYRSRETMPMYSFE